MLFQSPTFLVFFTIVVLVFAAGGAARWRKLVLILASCIFYMWWSPIFIFLLLGPMAIDFNVARWLERVDDLSRRRMLVTLSIVVNFGLLIFFKYYVFLAHNVLRLAQGFGFDVHWQPFDVTLPIGISFYTFERMSYTIDIYRRRARAASSLLDYSLFITFFPRLIAGPIVRAAEFLPQLRSKLALRFDAGIFFLLLRGLTKKVVVADNLSPFVERVLSAPGAWPSVVIWLGAIAFAAQIYCDFSGYSDMAIGLGRVFGLELPQNFNHPYFSRNPSEFWRRWNMTLSFWLRDYLYISLGGNRSGKARTYVNQMITMLLGGLWHGANWSFMLWGFLHGLALGVHRGLQDLGMLGRRASSSRLVRAVSIVVAQYWVLLCWIPFRITDTPKMLTAVRKFVLFDGNFRLGDLGLGAMSLFSTILLLAAFVVLHALSARSGGLDRLLSRLPLAAGLAVAFAAGIVLVVLWPLSEAPFIYFQF